MNNTLISICIPAYNASRYIGETLHSIAKQTYRHWEIVVVEDGSMDGTKEIVQEFKELITQTITYIRNEKNLGPASTRNIAAGCSKGGWIAFLDSDDLWHENHLADLVDTSLKNKDCDLVHSGVDVFDSQTGEVIFRQVLTPETVRKFPLSIFDRSYGVQPSSAIISRKLYDTIGGSNVNFRYTDDMEMLFRCAKAGFKFAYSGNNTCYYRKHPGALTSNALGVILNIAEVYDINADWKEIPENVRLQYASGAWLSAAKMARRNNRSKTPSTNLPRLTSTWFFCNGLIS